MEGDIFRGRTQGNIYTLGTEYHCSHIHRIKRLDYNFDFGKANIDEEYKVDSYQTPGQDQDCVYSQLCNRKVYICS